MNIKIVGRKVNLRENFKELVQRKLSKFDRIFDEDADATVTVTLEKNRQTVEIMIKQRGMLYRADRDGDTGEIDVVYKRRDGKYGVLEPEG